MGALDQLLANNKGTAASQPVTNVKLTKATSNLASATQRLKTQAQASPNLKGGSLQNILNQADNVAAGKPSHGFHFSLNPIEDIGQVANAIPGVPAVLKALDTPASYVRSTVNQTANALDFSDNKGFDLGQLNSDALKHKGLGDYFQEQLVRNAAEHGGKAQLFGLKVDPNSNNLVNRWGKRIVGLAGDVAADPLTYVGGGVTDAAGEISHALSTANRVELAKTAASLAEKGVPQATDEAIATLGRKGVMGLDKETRLALGMQPTLRVGRQAIPGTEGIASAIRTVTGKAREVAGDTVLGKTARSIGSSPVEKSLTEDVVSGGTHAATAAKALEGLDFAKAEARKFGAEQGGALKKILAKAPKSELKTLAGDIEAGGAATATSQKVRSFLENVRTEANSKGANLAKIEDYYPHVLTQDAKDALAQSGDLKGASRLAAGPELLRKYKPGEDFMGTTLQHGTADEVNGIYQAVTGGKAGLFESDAAKALPNYIQATQTAVQRGSYANRLVDHGVASPIVPKAEKFAAEAADIKPAEVANNVAQMSQATAITDPSHLVESLDHTAKAATVVEHATPGVAVPAAESVDRAKQLIGTYSNDPVAGPIATLEAGALNAEAKSHLLGEDVTFDEMNKFVHSSQARQVTADQINNGFQEISKGIAAPEWLAEATKVQRALTPEGYRKFLAGWDRFTQLWKAGATFSPGFHVRNAYSGVFNNFVAGVKQSSYKDFYDLAKAAEKGTLRGADQEAWDYASRAVEATGNPFDPAEIGKAAKPAAHKIIGGPGRISRTAGNFVENNLRGAMAIDSFRSGEELSSAIARIERFHFNYADVSDFDRAAKRIIPFWMFTSRNLPLQMQMIIRRPNAYLKYLAFQRNLSLGVKTPDIVPGYFGEQGAIPTDLPLPGGTGQKFLALDLPFLRVQKDAQMLTDPVRLLAEANPLVKVPIEQLAGKKLYNNQPFSDIPNPINKVLRPIAPLLEGLGLAEQSANGPTMTDRQLNTIESLFPLAGRANRLLPSDELMKQRAGTSAASFFGLSSLTDSPAAQTSELNARARAIAALLKSQQDLGYIPKAAKKSKPFG